MTDNTIKKKTWLPDYLKGIYPEDNSVNVENAGGKITDEKRKFFLLGGSGDLCIRGDSTKGFWAGNKNFDDAKWSVSLAGITKGGIPIASTTVLGGIKLGDGLSIDINGVLTVTGVTYTFYEHSVIQSAGMGIPKTIVVDRACTIDKVYIHLETAPGSAKTLTVDVNKNGTTIFTTQSKRPSITGTATVDESDTPDVVALAKNDLLTMDIDVNDGAAAKLSVYVRCK